MTQIDMDRITTELGDAYKEHKDAEVRFAGEAKGKKNRKSGLKEDFLEAATELVAQGSLAQKTVVVEAGSLEDAEEEAKKRNPRWLIIDSKVVALPDRDIGAREGYAIVLEEDPLYKPYTYVNPRTKLVWTKQVVDGSAWLDDDRLKTNDIRLYARVTRIINFDLMMIFINALADAHPDPAACKANLIDVYSRSDDAKRELIPLEELDSATMAALQNYIYPGKPSVKLAAPRKAKPEELEDGS